jgi:diacylglycerol kinase family enzyme/membrane-associated phospholipid phosphatase
VQPQPAASDAVIDPQTQASPNPAGTRVRKVWPGVWARWRERRHLPAPIQKADETAYAWIATRHSQALDATLPRLSKAADHSKLWVGVAALLMMFGGRGRKAALRGIASVLLSSAMVNGPLKWFSNRRRPDPGLIPAARRLARAPTSSSFPSGHSASAAAFATAVAAEMPVAAAPVGLLAAGVGFSRVYTGVHYPVDVLAGAALGMTAALVTKASSKTREHLPPGPLLDSAQSLELKDGTGVVAFINPSAGPALSRNPVEDFSEAFPKATVLTEAEDVADVLRKECSSETRAIIVGGGDGTVGAAASVALELDLPLGVLPAGTLNHFARDLGLRDMEHSFEVLQQGRLAEIDVAEIAGRCFLNTASFAAYAELVDHREQLEGKIGKWPAAAIALLRMLKEKPIEVELDGRAMKVWAIFIGNGRHSPGLVPSRRLALDDAKLDIRVLRADVPLAHAKALIQFGPRRMVRSPSIESWTARMLRVKAQDSKLRLAADGETFDGPGSFRVEKKKRLVVFVP